MAVIFQLTIAVAYKHANYPIYLKCRIVSDKDGMVVRHLLKTDHGDLRLMVPLKYMVRFGITNS